MHDSAGWHQRRPDLLRAALARFDHAAPHVQELARRFLPHLPRRPLANQTLRASHPSPYSLTQPLDVVADCPWISTDSATHKNALIFDIDHEDGIDLVAALPADIRPWLVIDPWSGRSHAVMFLASPVLVTERGSRKARRLAEVAQAMMAEALRATPLRHRAPVKNPLGRVDALLGQQLRRTPKPTMPALWDAWQTSGSPLIWHTIPGAGPVELRDVIAALADDYGDSVGDSGSEEAAELRPASRTFTKRRPEPSAVGRNCSMFDTIRRWAYDRAECDGGLILAEALRANTNFATPLPVSEVAATARSIAKFMRTRFRPRHGPGIARGRDRQAGAALPPEARKAYAGQRTAATRAAKTDAQISAAVKRLHVEGARMTQAAIAAQAGVSLRTVKGRWSAILPRLSIVQDAALSGDAPASAPLPATPTGASTPVQEHQPATADEIDAVIAGNQAIQGGMVRTPSKIAPDPGTRLQAACPSKTTLRWQGRRQAARQVAIQRRVTTIDFRSRHHRAPASTGPPYRALLPGTWRNEPVAARSGNGHLLSAMCHVEVAGPSGRFTPMHGCTVARWGAICSAD